MSIPALSDKSRKPTPKKYILSRWEYISEVLTEPIILAFAAFLMFDHIRNVWDATHNLGDFWHKLNEPTGINVLIALTFFGAIAIWGWVKALRIRREYRRDEGISDSIATLADSIRQLTDEIRKDREIRHEQQSTSDKPKDM